MEELLHAPLEELENPKELEFKIYTLNSASSQTSKGITNCKQLNKNENSQSSSLEREQLLDEEKEILKNTKFEIEENLFTKAYVQPLVSLLKSVLEEEEPFVLDIDMDFFSTKNPFKELFDEVRLFL